MAITIDGVTYRNLQEQVGKNAEDIYDLRKNSARAIVKGETPLEKVHVTGESNLEGPVTAGGPMEVDGPLTVNSLNDIKFKEDDTTLSKALTIYSHNINIWGNDKDQKNTYIAFTAYSHDGSKITSFAQLIEFFDGKRFTVAGTTARGGNYVTIMFDYDEGFTILVRSLDGSFYEDDFLGVFNKYNISDEVHEI